MKDVDTECVDNANCTNMAAEGAAEELKCLCKQGFHPKKPADGGASVCEAGTCAFLGDWAGLFCFQK